MIIAALRVMRKLFITLGLFSAISFGTALIVSCNNEDDCGFEFVNQRPISIIAESQIITNRRFSADRLYRYSFTEYDGSARDFDEIGIEITYDLEMIASNRRVGSIGNQAFACSPPPQANRLTSFTVTSDNDFGFEFPAGTVINGFFLFSFDYLEEMGEIDQNALLDGFPLFFKLANGPAVSGAHNFTFRMEFEDGTVEEVQSGVIQIER